MAGYRVRFYDDDDDDLPPPLEDDEDEDPYIDGVPPPDFRPLGSAPLAPPAPTPPPPPAPAPAPAPAPPPPAPDPVPPPIVVAPPPPPPIVVPPPPAPAPVPAPPPPPIVFAAPPPIVFTAPPPIVFTTPPPPAVAVAPEAVAVDMPPPPPPEPPTAPLEVPAAPQAAYFQSAAPGLPPGYAPPATFVPMDAALPEDLIKAAETEAGVGAEGSQSPGALRDFQVVSGWRDLWAAILFMLHVAAVAGMALIFGLRALGKSSSRLGGLEGGSRAHRYDILEWVPQLGAAGAVGLAFALVWQTLFRVFMENMVVWAMWFGVFAMFCLGIVLISTGTAIGTVGLIFIMAAVLQALYTYREQPRKQFTNDMLAKVLKIKPRYRFSIFLVTYFGLLVAAAWQAVFIFGVAGAISQSYAGYFVLIFIVSLAWTMEVIKNVLNVAVSGVVAIYYFQENCMPRGPGRHALLRACSTSFGSVCLGSIFVAPIEALRILVRSVSSAQGGREFPFACCNCLDAALQWLSRYFNKWAFVHVAIYGKSFVWAARSTWDMVKQQGVQQLLDDDLTNNVFFVGSFAGGSLSAIVGAGWEWATHKSFTVSVAVISFFLGYFFTYISVVVYQSGMAAIYVCYAEDPEALRRHDPETFSSMQERLNYLKPQLS